MNRFPIVPPPPRGFRTWHDYETVEELALLRSHTTTDQLRHVLEQEAEVNLLREQGRLGEVA